MWVVVVAVFFCLLGSVLGRVPFVLYPVPLLGVPSNHSVHCFGLQYSFSKITPPNQTEHPPYIIYYTQDLQLTLLIAGRRLLY